MIEQTKFENPDYDGCVIGETYDGRLIYDFELMVEHLVREDDITEEEAIEFIEYNTLRSLPYAKGHYPNVPIVVQVLE